MNTTIEAFIANHQSIYFNQSNAVSAARNLIEFANDQFQSSYIFKNKELLKELVVNKNNLTENDLKKIASFTQNSLIDNIRISVCFENLFKAVLLSRLYLVHNLDHNLFKQLSKEQKKRPVSILELLEETSWTTNDNIISDIPEINKSIRGISTKTINYSTILKSKEYMKILNLKDDIVRLLTSINDERNQLHLHQMKSFKIDSHTFNDFDKLCVFLKKNINNLKNEYNNFLGLDDQNSTPTFKVTILPESQIQ